MFVLTVLSLVVMSGEPSEQLVGQRFGMCGERYILLQSFIGLYLP